MYNSYQLQRMHGHGAVRYAMYAVTITKLELLRTNIAFDQILIEGGTAWYVTYGTYCSGTSCRHLD